MSFSKKELAKRVHPGIWVKVDWDDAQGVRCLVIGHNSFRDAGKIDIQVYDPASLYIRWIDHPQIAAIGERVMIPSPGAFREK